MDKMASISTSVTLLLLICINFVFPCSANQNPAQEEKMEWNKTSGTEDAPPFLLPIS